MYPQPIGKRPLALVKRNLRFAGRMQLDGRIITELQRKHGFHYAYVWKHRLAFRASRVFIAYRYY